MTNQQQHTNQTVHSVVSLIDLEMRRREADGIIISKEEMYEILDYVESQLVHEEPERVVVQV